ncbi:Transposable element Tc1 transposase [Labeo rohita]|uniref:Transposable element Tc1 transposase n=1 Tax=Labeo rohita TaxID=84645 RepID=A0ABQ8LT62_LABRO|nr:Transposable element Tc1 transposase [Labeo rohita]
MGKIADLTVVQKTITDTFIRREWTEAGVKASRATTHRYVKEFGYSCRIPLVKPLLNHRQHQRCLTWAKEKKKWTVAQWSKVLFSDESMRDEMR